MTTYANSDDLKKLYNFGTDFVFDVKAFDTHGLLISIDYYDWLNDKNCNYTAYFNCGYIAVDDNDVEYVFNGDTFIEADTYIECQNPNRLYLEVMSISLFGLETRLCDNIINDMIDSANEKIREWQSKTF